MKFFAAILWRVAWGDKVGNEYKENPDFNLKRAFGVIQEHIVLYDWLHDIVQVLNMVAAFGGFHYHVVNIDFHVPLYLVG